MGQLGVTMRYKMPRYGNGGLAMGFWQWGSSAMRSRSVYGIGIATMGWGGGGMHPHPMCGRGSCQLGLHYVRNVYLERFRPGAIALREFPRAPYLYLEKSAGVAWALGAGWICT